MAARLAVCRWYAAGAGGWRHRPGWMRGGLGRRGRAARGGGGRRGAAVPAAPWCPGRRPAAGHRPGGTDAAVGPPDPRAVAGRWAGLLRWGAGSRRPAEGGRLRRPGASGPGRPLPPSSPGAGVVVGAAGGAVGVSAGGGRRCSPPVRRRHAGRAAGRARGCGRLGRRGHRAGQHGRRRRSTPCWASARRDRGNPGRGRRGEAVGCPVPTGRRRMRSAASRTLEVTGFGEARVGVAGGAVPLGAARGDDAPAWR